MKMYAKVVTAVIMGSIMGMMVADADGHDAVDSNVVVMPPAPFSSLHTSVVSPSSRLHRQGQETLSTMEPTTSEAVMMDPPVDGQDVTDDADAVDANDADAVMMDPPISTSNASIAWDESDSQGTATSGMVDVVVPVQDSYDYTNYQDLLSRQWPAMTETCVNGKQEFEPLTQKRVYTVGVQATAGVEEAWLQYNTTFVTYLNAVVGPRFEPPIQFEMEVTTRPLNQWVSEVATDIRMVVLVLWCFDLLSVLLSHTPTQTHGQCLSVSLLFPASILSFVD
jgi:hypothetical protein